MPTKVKNMVTDKKEKPNLLVSMDVTLGLYNVYSESGLLVNQVDFSDML